MKTDVSGMHIHDTHNIYIQGLFICADAVLPELHWTLSKESSVTYDFLKRRTLSTSFEYFYDKRKIKHDLIPFT